MLDGTTSINSWDKCYTISLEVHFKKMDSTEFLLLLPTKKKTKTFQNRAVEKLT